MAFYQSQNLLGAYAQALAKTEPLSRQEEQALAARIQRGDLEARNTLIEANLRFVVEVARQHQHRGLTLEELVSAGNEGLITAAERFDGARGLKFITYAVWWIRMEMQRAIANQSRTVRLPCHKQQMIKDIQKTTHYLNQDREKIPSIEAIAHELDVPIEEVSSVLITASTPLSLTENRSDDKRQLLELIPDEQQTPPDEAVLQGSDKAVINQALQRLDARERQILGLYFGLDGYAPLYLEQIGALLGLTRERVRQLKERALAKLRSPEVYQALYAT